MPLEADLKAHLRQYLQAARDALLGKLDGLSEYDVRRPLTPTGTNLLGLVKHLTGVELAYLGHVFGRRLQEPIPWFDAVEAAEAAGAEVEPNVDMWATPAESREGIIGDYRRVWAHADATIEELDLAATAPIPWWRGGDAVPLHRLAVHVIGETNRHAGHADIVRELIDGSAGMRGPQDNLPTAGPDWWTAYRDRVERAAREAGGRN